jgi:DNA-binding NarL/FixJ family response regulator
VTTIPVKLHFRRASARKPRVPITTIILADDNCAVLAHVSKMLGKQKGYKVIASISDGKIIASECLRLRSDVIIMDISIATLNGIHIARQLRVLGCAAKIVFLTVHEDSDYVSAAMHAGGSAYVVKSRLSSDLLPAIRAVLSNKVFVSPVVINGLT